MDQQKKSDIFVYFKELSPYYDLHRALTNGAPDLNPPEYLTRITQFPGHFPHVPWLPYKRSVAV